MLTTKQINDEFCKELGIKKVICMLENTDTKEKRYYSSPSAAYKYPAGWKNVKKIMYKQAHYPDLISNANNFTKLLNVQWNVFGSIGDVYNKTGNETFEETYLKTRLRAIKLCKSLGGGDGYNTYKDKINSIKFDY